MRNRDNISHFNVCIVCVYGRDFKKSNITKQPNSFFILIGKKIYNFFIKL